MRVQYPEDVYKEPFSRRSDDGDRHFNLGTTIETGRDFAEGSSELRIGVDEVTAIAQRERIELRGERRDGAAHAADQQRARLVED